MGGAVSKVSGAIKSVTGAVGGISGTALGGTVGSGVSAMVDQLGLEVKPADFTNLQAAYAASGGDAAKFNDAFKQLQAQSNSQLGITQQAIGTSQNAINQAAGVTLGTQGQALDYASSMAEGTAPSAAQAQLQSGKDQAIATQMAMANSGNLSQMIGGQRNAMNNAANLNQQSANQAAQLRAEQQIAGMQQYGTQANSASQLAQGISAQQQAQAGQQADIYGNQLNTQQSMAGAENTAQANAITAANQKATLAQQANEATAKYKAQATGGLMNAAGGAASVLLASGGIITGNSSSNTNGLSASNTAGIHGNVRSIIDSQDPVIPPVNFSKKPKDSTNPVEENMGEGVKMDSSPEGGGATETAIGDLSASTGGRVEGKIVVKGDNTKNDIVPVKLSAGEIVIPKSHAYSIPMAIKFLENIMSAKKSDDTDHDGVVRPDEVSKENHEEKSFKSLGMLLEAYKNIDKKIDKIDSYFKAKAKKG